jgi:hypothetical protein
MATYTRQQTFKQLQELDQYVRDYADKISALKEDDSMMYGYYFRKILRDCNEMKIPEVTSTESIDK